MEEVGELERTCDGLTSERNKMLVKLEGLKRRKHIETEVSTKNHFSEHRTYGSTKAAPAKSRGGVEHLFRMVLLMFFILNYLYAMLRLANVNVDPSAVPCRMCAVKKRCLLP